MIPAQDLDASGVTAVTVSNGKIEFRIDEFINSRFARELPAIGLLESLPDSFPDRITIRRHR
jgi:hypothetical protein